MKNLLFLAMGLIMIGATSCVKDWKCECTDGNYTATVAMYPSTKYLDAKKSCDAKQTDLRTINSSVSCKVK